jgi:hypothetical protein
MKRAAPAPPPLKPDDNWQSAVVACVRRTEIKGFDRDGRAHRLPAPEISARQIAGRTPREIVAVRRLHHALRPLPIMKRALGQQLRRAGGGQYRRLVHDPAIPEQRRIDLVLAGLRRHQDRLIALRLIGGNGRKRVDADHRNIKGEAKSARHGKADADAGELPGPVVTAMRSSSENASPASSITLRTMGASASAWPRSISTWALASARSWPLSPAATEQAAMDVSMARSFMPRRDRPQAWPPSNRTHFAHFRNEVAQQVSMPCFNVAVELGSLGRAFMLR